MDFDFFAQRIPKIKNLPLPGEVSHYKMIPDFRQEELKAHYSAKKNAKQAGVMALCYPEAGHLAHLLLILRKTYKGVHSNQVAFPGGKAESEDNGLLATALRETEEEVGVSPQQIEIFKELTPIYIPPSNFEVQPFLGVCHTQPDFKIQEEEVAALVKVRLTEFLDDANVFEETLSTSYAKNVAVPAFRLNGHTVWGATAMMLSEVKELMKQVL
ncbi:CoA pyrophosphatase [Aggregatimonas sangjinii]|uniref:CoA pyrophosphatase n=1 Tax=Aggregatimonas sangjinii TaxID=2583587 RepID=A0A5B7SLA7_9FLAO|nr:CoA pyrophosphatase [Aggregatimonas sangjinii]QCW99325.1 CoA pyrophosphatase [Aggregatimonas sangjinii]